MRCGEFCAASCEVTSDDIAADLGPVVAGRPGDQDLRFGEQQRAQPVGLNLKIGDVGAQPRFGAGGANAGAHQENRGDDGETEQRQRRGQHREFLMVEVRPGRNQLRE